MSKNDPIQLKHAGRF